MHEFSIVQSLLSLIESYAEENGAFRVSKVVVSVGVLSGVEPSLLETAFNTFKEGTVAQDAELLIELEKLKLKCGSCGKESEKEELNLVCPECGSQNTEVTGGEDLLLKSLEMECEETLDRGQM